MRLEGILLDAAGKVSPLSEKALEPEKSRFLPLASHTETLYDSSCLGTVRGETEVKSPH